MSFAVKDSGKRQVFDSGMVRDVTAGKIGWHLVSSGPMLMRWAVHLTKGAEKYDEDNWLKADGEDELKRFKKSAFRHFMQWYYGDTDEDHAAAVYFNINGHEYVKERIETEADEEHFRGLLDAAARGELVGVAQARAELYADAEKHVELIPDPVLAQQAERAAKSYGGTD
jgi:hypothetical protein